MSYGPACEWAMGLLAVVGNQVAHAPLPGHPSGSTKVGRETTSRSKSELLTSDSVVCYQHTHRDLNIDNTEEIRTLVT